MQLANGSIWHETSVCVLLMSGCAILMSAYVFQDQGGATLFYNHCIIQEQKYQDMT